jgi:hypothetical protein
MGVDNLVLKFRTICNPRVCAKANGIKHLQVGSRKTTTIAIEAQLFELNSKLNQGKLPFK